MPDTLESIKKLYDNADLNEKLDYLFDGMIKLNDNMKNGLSSVNASIKGMQEICIERKRECKEIFATKKCNDNFVTKKHAKTIGGIMLALAIGIGFGAGWITFADAFRYASPIIP